MHCCSHRAIFFLILLLCFPSSTNIGGTVVNLGTDIHELLKMNNVVVCPLMIHVPLHLLNT